MPNTTKTETKRSTNLLLAALPDKDYDHCSKKLERVELKYGATIYKTGATIKHVYFPESGIVSLLSAVEEQTTLEVGIVGSEGMLGLPVFLGVSKSNNLAARSGRRCRFANGGGGFYQRMCFRQGNDADPKTFYVFTNDTDGSVGGLQSFSSYRFAHGTLAVDDARPDEIGRISDHTGVFVEYGWRTARSGQ